MRERLVYYRLYCTHLFALVAGVLLALHLSGEVMRWTHWLGALVFVFGVPLAIWYAYEAAR